jgi:hypothetical protein
MSKLTPAQERNQAKKQWGAKLRQNGHTLTWQFSREGGMYSGDCKNCPGHIMVYNDGHVSTVSLGWTGSKPCPAKKRGARR